MLEFLLSWLILSLGVYGAAVLLPGVHLRNFKSAILVAAGLGILNVLIGWFLFFVLGLGTLGLGFLFAFVTRWVVDAILLKLIDKFSRSLRIDSFFSALGAALIIAAIGFVGELLLF